MVMEISKTREQVEEKGINLGYYQAANLVLRARRELKDLVDSVDEGLPIHEALPRLATIKGMYDLGSRVITQAGERCGRHDTVFGVMSKYQHNFSLNYRSLLDELRRKHR